MSGFRRIHAIWVGDEMTTHAFRKRRDGELAAQSECGLPRDPTWSKSGSEHCSHCKHAMARNRR